MTMGSNNTLTDTSGSERDVLNGIIYKNALTFVTIVYWIGIIIYAYSTPVPRGQFGVLFLGGSFVIFGLDELMRISGDERFFRLKQIGFLSTIVVMLISTGYIVLNYRTWVLDRTGYATDVDLFVAALVVIVTIALTWYKYGNLFALVAIGSLVYAYFGPYFPGFLEHAGLGVLRFLQISVTDLGGIYGSLTRLVATWIALFLLLAGLYEKYGAFDLILLGAFKVATHIRSGVAQSGIIASMIIGSINGSAAANTAITGSVTIPLMKNNNIKGETAGGIEAVASAGGQIMPPVMGAAAFLMASLLGISYTSVLLAGIVPSIIFYVSIFVATHYLVVAELEENDMDELYAEMDAKYNEIMDQFGSRQDFLIEVVKFIIPFGLLIYFLAIAQFTVMTSALYAVVSLMAVGILLPLSNDPSVSTLKEVLGQTVAGGVRGAQGMAAIAIIVAAINLIIDVLLTTGVPTKLSLVLLELSGGSFILAIALAMVICIILGMGMPTVSAYLIVAILIAPTLINQFGLPELAAHYFVFYAAILSALSPPIAGGVAIAAGLANANFWKTAYQSLRISAPVFVLPFMFAIHPELVSTGLGPERLVTAGLGIFGAASIAFGVSHPLSMLSGKSRYAVRGLFLVFGIGLMVSTGIGRILTLAVAVIFVLALKYSLDIELTGASRAS